MPPKPKLSVITWMPPMTITKRHSWYSKRSVLTPVGRSWMWLDKELLRNRLPRLKTSLPRKSTQSLSFRIHRRPPPNLQAYKKAGKDIGNLLDSVGVRGAGGKDLQVVFWGSGGWFADPAKKVMQDAITSLGQDGFDSAYVENDEMMTGALS